MKREIAADMLDMLYRLLPYIEELESDKANKPGVVRKLRLEMLAIIKRAEANASPK